MVLDAQFVVQVSNGSEMCILGEFVKVHVFLNFLFEFCDIERKSRRCSVLAVVVARVP